MESNGEKNTRSFFKFDLDFTFPPSHDGNSFLAFLSQHIPSFQEQSSQVSRTSRQFSGNHLSFAVRKVKGGVDFVEFYNGDSFKCCLTLYILRS